MPSASASVLSPRFVLLKLGSIVLALCSLLAPAGAWAACTTSGGTTTCTSSDVISIPSNTSGNFPQNAVPANTYPSLMNVSGLSGTVATAQVVLKSMEATASNPYQSVFYTEIMLVSPDNRELEIFGLPGNGSDALNGLTVTIADGSSLMPTFPNAMPASGSVTFAPTSYAGSEPYPPGPTNTTPSFPRTNGSATLASIFSGASPNGNWKLYMMDQYGDPVTINGWELILTVNATNVATTTSVSSSQNPSFTTTPTNGVTFTANVSSTGGTPTGTVSFSANGAAIAGCSAQPLSGGIATCNTTLTTQGMNSIQANYNGVGSFVSSSGTLNQLVEVHATNSAGDTWCNNTALPIPGESNGQPGETAYPWVIGVPSSVTQTVGDVTVQLNGVAPSAADGIANSSFLLVAPNGKNLDLLDGGWLHAYSGGGTVNLTFSDSGGTVSESTQVSGGTYLASDDESVATIFPTQSPSASSIDSSIPGIPATIHYAQPFGGATASNLEGAFSGAPAAGDWALYILNEAGSTGNISINSWCVNFTLNTGVATTTTLASNANPASSGSPVTLSATVMSGGNPVNAGTVNFTDSSTGTTLAANVAVNTSGLAITTISTLTEGDHNITASYSGVANAYDPSTTSLWQRVDHPTTVSGTSPVMFCNPGGIKLPGGPPPNNSGAATPNPSNIFVSNLPGTINNVELELETFQTGGQPTISTTSSLLVGPGAQNSNSLDFFSETGNDLTVLSAGNYTFTDSATSEAPQSAFGPGSYKPTSYATAADTFFSSPSGFYLLPGTFDYAATKGTSTFADLYQGTNPNGTWSLYFNQKTSVVDTTAGATGWCLGFTENAPNVTATAAHSGNFTQGQTGAQLTVNIDNNGPGATGDPSAGSNPMTVTDTLNAAFTYTGFTGTNWSCSAAGQVVTCTNDSAIADASSYPSLTLNVNVLSTASGNVSNSASVSGAGVAATNSNTDPITIVPSTVLSVAKSHTGTFTQGATAEWDVVVSNSASSGSSSGTVTVVDTLPANYSVSTFGTNSGWTCGGTAIVTCTSTNSIAGGGSFPTIQIFVNVPASSPTSVTNNVVAYGGGDAVHTNSANGVTASDTPAIVQAPASITINAGGSPQSATVNTIFANPLAVTVKDANNAVINGASVTFTAPSAGASGTFSNSLNTISVNTASGVASAGAFTANAIAGGPFNVTATAGAVSATFVLTNVLPQFVLTTSANPSIGGTVTPTSGGSYSQGTSVPLTAMAAAGYAFTGWTSAPDSVANSASTSTSITMNSAESVMANFAPFATAVPTTTIVSSSQNPSFTAAPNQSVQFTAMITSGGNPVTIGTVEFSSGGVDLPGCSAVALDGTGQAQCTDSFAAEGTLTILATYSGYSSLSASYITSNGTVSQEADNHTAQNGNQFCNTGAIAIPNASGSATPYPSRIFVSGFTGNVGKLTVQLNGINSSDTQPTDLMLVGPTGAQIIPVAGVGNATTISGVNITLDDAASDLLGSSALTTGTFRPTSMTGGTSLLFPAPAPAASAANYAATDGPATLGSIFTNTAPNGTWSLYSMASSANGANSISGGWCVNITPAVAPAITSANSTNVNLNSPLSFTVTTTGTPTPSITEEGSLPIGVTFHDNGDGTASLGGTPATGGSFSISFTASNGAGNNALQNFTLNVGAPPAITSASSTTFDTGTLGSFTVTSNGSPTSSLGETGNLPIGVSFHDNGNGTANLTGTPANGSGGTYPLTVTAQNGVPPNASQSFTLTVDQAPAITSAASTTFATGSLGSFTVAATGFPTPTITESGVLPTGVTFLAGKLSGTPTQSGSFPIMFFANNGVGTQASQSFTLTVDQAPAITSANHAAFTLGASSSFTVTTTGFPIPTSLAETGSLPTGVTFTNKGNGTATLAGIPTTGGTFNITLIASNGVSPNATQNFTLTASGPLVGVSPSSISFGTVYFGSLNTRNITVTNTGNTAMTITDPLLSIVRGGDSNEFFAVNLCPRSLAAGKSCTIIITFIAGPLYNPQTATLSIVDNAPGSPQTVNLTAQVIDPIAQLSATILNFGTQKQNTSSTIKVITLANPGATPLTISSIAISGANPQDFSETSNCTAPLAPRSSCSIDVAFKPTTKGSRSANIVITDNAQNSTQKISLAGTGN